MVKKGMAAGPSGGATAGSQPAVAQQSSAKCKYNKDELVRELSRSHRDTHDENLEINPPIPFFTLRSFLDLLFSVLLAFSFLKLTDHLSKLADIISSGHALATLGKTTEALTLLSAKVISDAGGYPVLPAIQKHLAAQGAGEAAAPASGSFISFAGGLWDTISLSVHDYSFWGELGSVFILCIVIVMFLDDYYRARILTWLAPCRSIARVSLDTVIYFLFSCSVMLADKFSYFFLLPLAMAFLMRCWWADLTMDDARKWQECEEIFEEKHGRPVPRGTNLHAANITDESAWAIYRDRLDYILTSHFTVFFMLMSVMAVFLFSPKLDDCNKFASEKISWLICAVIFFIAHGGIEILRCQKEEKLAAAVRNLGQELSAPLKSVVFLPLRKRKRD